MCKYSIFIYNVHFSCGRQVRFPNYHFFMHDLFAGCQFNTSVRLSFSLYIWINSYYPDSSNINVIPIQSLIYETNSLWVRVYKHKSQYCEKYSTELLLFCTSKYRPTYDPALLMALSAQEVHADIVVWGMFWESDLLAWTDFPSKAPTWPLLTQVWPPGLRSRQNFNQQSMQKSEGQWSLFVCVSDTYNPHLSALSHRPLVLFWTPCPKHVIIDRLVKASIGTPVRLINEHCFFGDGMTSELADVFGDCDNKAVLLRRW